MHTEVFRTYLVRDKAFLRELYEGQSRLSNNRILFAASDSKLNTLIRFLHYLANGEIKMKKENFEAIQTHKKLNVIKRNVEKKAALSRLLKSERITKMKFLKQISAVFGPLLYCLFNET
jgi:thiaminase